MAACVERQGQQTEWCVIMRAVVWIASFSFSLQAKHTCTHTHSPQGNSIWPHAEANSSLKTAQDELSKWYRKAIQKEKEVWFSIMQSILCQEERMMLCVLVHLSFSRRVCVCVCVCACLCVRA